MHDDRIERYLANDMNAEERAAFERAIEADPALRGEVEALRGLLGAARAWFDAPAPGVEHAEALAAPPLAQRRETARVLPVAWVWRVAAAFAIFAAGYWFGAERSPAAAPQQHNVTQQHQVPPAEQKEETDEAEAPPVHAASAPGAQIAQAPEPPRVREEDGRVIIETASATWVIDPEFNFDAVNGTATN